MSQGYNMRYPDALLKRIDTFQKTRGFLHRSQAITYLIQRALDLERHSHSKGMNTK